MNKKPNTVYAKVENLTLALNSAQSIGCNVVNIDAHDLMKGKQHLVLGLLWQIIRIGLFNQITLEQCPGLANLLMGGEKIEDLMKLSPEAILLRWVNHQLERAGVPRRVANFTTDIADSEVYTHLLYQIAPMELGVTKEALMESDQLNRAEIMLQQADKLGCRSFISPKDVVEGIYKLNLAFVANLFNNHPSMDASNIDLEDYVNVEESREERSELFAGIGRDLSLFPLSSLSKLDEQPWCFTLCELALLGPCRRPHHLSTVRNNNTRNCPMEQSSQARPFNSPRNPVKLLSILLITENLIR